MTGHVSTSALDALMAQEDAFAHGPETGALFLAAMQEAFAFHYEASPVYRALSREAAIPLLVSQLETVPARASESFWL